MVTLFGKELRILRMNVGELLKDMAERLKVSSSYLSAIENGKREIPDDFVQKVIKEYQLDEAKAETLKKAADESALNIKIDLKNATPQQRAIAQAVARNLNRMLIYYDRGENLPVVKKAKEIIKSVKEHISPKKPSDLNQDIPDPQDD